MEVEAAETKEVSTPSKRLEGPGQVEEVEASDEADITMTDVAAETSTYSTNFLNSATIKLLEEMAMAKKEKKEQEEKEDARLSAVMKSKLKALEEGKNKSDRSDDDGSPPRVFLRVSSMVVKFGLQLTETVPSW